ncbi:MAG: hypothetical protein AAF756_17875 [Pseudomonadota bacterium]
MTSLNQRQTTNAMRLTTLLGLVLQASAVHATTWGAPWGFTWTISRTVESIPTLGFWGVLATSGLVLCLGAFNQRSRKNKR